MGPVRELCRRWEIVLGESPNVETAFRENIAAGAESCYDDCRLVSSSHISTGSTQERHFRDLRHLRDALRMVPTDECLEYECVSTHFPCLVRYESPPILFVIRDDYDHYAAARRLCKYWKKRIQAFEIPEVHRDPSLTRDVTSSEAYALSMSKGYRPFLVHPPHRRPNASQRQHVGSLREYSYFYCGCLHPHCLRIHESQVCPKKEQDVRKWRISAENEVPQPTADDLDQYFALDANERRLLAAGWLSILRTYDYGEISPGDHSYYSLPVIHLDRKRLSTDMFRSAKVFLQFVQEKERLLLWFATQVAVKHAPYAQVDGFRLLARVMGPFAAGFSASASLALVHQIHEVFPIRLYRIDVYVVPPNNSSRVRKFFRSTLLRVIFSKLPAFLRWKVQLQMCDTVDEMRDRLLMYPGGFESGTQQPIEWRKEVPDPRDTQKMFWSSRHLPTKFGGEWNASADPLPVNISKRSHSETCGESTSNLRKQARR
jgi:hypothetical protein